MGPDDVPSVMLTDREEVVAEVDIPGTRDEVNVSESVVNVFVVVAAISLLLAVAAAEDTPICVDRSRGPRRTWVGRERADVAVVEWGWAGVETGTGVWAALDVEGAQVCSIVETHILFAPFICCCC